MNRRGAILATVALASVALGTVPSAGVQNRTMLSGDGFSLSGSAQTSPSTCVLSGEGLTLVGTLSEHRPLVASGADVAEPFGVLDTQDKVRFMALLGAADPAADLAEPKGVVDSSDLSEFIRRYESGRP